MIDRSQRSIRRVIAPLVIEHVTLLLLLLIAADARNLDHELSMTPPRDDPGETITASFSRSQKTCISKAGLAWHPHPRKKELQWTLMSTPEFHTEPSGFQARCDWVIGSRQSHYHHLPSNVAWGEPNKVPRTIFVRTDLVSFFATEILPCLRRKFALITGDHDATLPRQVDKRYPRYIERNVWQDLLANPLLLHMFAENLDEAGGDKVSGIPLGVNPMEFPNYNGNFLIDKIPMHIPSLSERPLKMQNVDRQRDPHVATDVHGHATSQFVERQRVLERCRLNWTDFCVPRTLSQETFFESLREYPFVKCVHGGGLDPSPKAFEAVLSGTIPIIQHYAGDDAYRELPVVFVDDWEVDTITAEKLAAWRDELAPYYEQRELRADVLHRLSAAYWWGKVESVMEERPAGVRNNTLAIEGREMGKAKEWR